MPLNRLESTTPLLNLLVAYPYMSSKVIELIRDNYSDIRFLLDSGAFTAYYTGKKVTLDEYCKFLDNLPFKPWRYFQLDVIGDPDATAKNYEIMRLRGYNPVPVFTFGEDLSRLDELYKTTDLIAIGGLGNPKNQKAYVSKVMRYVKGRKVHLLGFTKDEYLKYYRPYMCDSSNWTASKRFAALKLYVGHGKSVAVYKKDFVKRPSREVENAVRRLGFSPEELAVKENWHGGWAISAKLNAASYVAKSVDFERNIGTKVFLACASTIDATQVIQAFQNQMRLERARNGSSLKDRP